MRRFLRWFGVIAGITTISLCSRAAPRTKAARQSATKDEPAVTLEARVAAYGGAYLEEKRASALAEAKLTARVENGRARSRFGAGYGFEPFTLKTSSFEEEQTDGNARLVQSMHAVDAFAEFQTRITRRLRLSLTLAGDAWFPEVALDRRWRGKTELKLRFGAMRGAYLSGDLGGQVKYFPQYFVAGRRIDQVEVAGTAELGYSFDRATKLFLRTELGVVRYLNARYDVLRDGQILPSNDNKMHIQRSIGIGAAWGVIEPVVLGARYEYRLNDSVHYDRRMTGRSADGALVAKFIPDYYDYERHEARMDADLRLGRRFRAEAGASYWFRGFDTYEARDADNLWTGELRRDRGLEISASMDFRVVRFDSSGVDSTVWLTSFGSRVMRRSNMRREVALATNFDVTRVFLGVAIETR